MELSEEYIYRDHKKLRRGFTTGSCAAAAAGAAIRLLLGEGTQETISIQTPKGVILCLPVLEQKTGTDWASAAIKKDSGDDPDATNGVLVCARVSWQDRPGIEIAGGEGIGRITKPGLACPVGAAAINRVPREMILQQVEQVLSRRKEHPPGVLVTISIPDGAARAAKTYNPRLGIIGGLSVLGTSGIVEPMSEQALVDSIHLEMKIRVAAGDTRLIVTPGNYGETFLREQYGAQYSPAELDAAVKCSNFIGEAIDSAVMLGFEHLLLIGHIGKLVKLAGGVMNTHSRYADCRMEILTAHAALAGASGEILGKLMDCITTDQAIALLEEGKIRQAVMTSLLDKIEFHLQMRAGERLQTGVILFSNQYGLLGQRGFV